MTNQFTKARRKKSKLRLGITGPSGSGKSYAALTLANSLGGKIAAIDTENGSLSIYESMADFDVINMAAPYTPMRMIEYIKMAEANGYDVLIIDSITHEWSGPGGCLEMNDTTARTKFKGNTWSAWSITKPLHRALLDAIIASPMHIIVTLRSKTETAQEGRNVVKLGMKAEQQDGFEYEMTIVLDIVHEGHFAIASKDRTGIFTDQQPQPITAETGKKLVKWLNSGAEPAPQAAPEPTPAPAPPKPEAPVAPPAAPKEFTDAETRELFDKAKGLIQAADSLERVETLRALVKTRQAQGALRNDQSGELLDLCDDMAQLIKAAEEPAPV